MIILGRQINIFQICFIIKQLQYQRHHQPMAEKLKPIQLISFDSNKKICVNSEAVKWLMKVNQQKHIGVVTVVGKYRTGKSYILNRVLLNQNSGFEVGPTINACTKGLWVWPQLIQNPNDPTIQYMVMDTEGLGSLEEGEQTDTKIFLMAMLLSSYFIYNSVGSIDEKAVQNLSLIINLSKLLQKGNEKQMQDIIDCFPSFMWLVRDFALRLEDESGRLISPIEYLENALKLQKGNSELVQRKNGIRKQLVNFFKQRDCFLLIRPVDDEKLLQNMATVKDSDLRPRFVELISQLRQRVTYNIKKKMFKGRPCSPAMFVDLCQHFCDSINQGGLPQIQSNWDLVCRAESNRVEKRCFEDFKKIKSKFESLNPTKINIKVFQQQIESQIAKILKYFEKNALGEKTQKKRVIKQKMYDQYEQLKKKISSARNQKLANSLNDLNREIENLVSQNIITSVYDITQNYDRIIEEEKKGASFETLSHLYQHCYNGLSQNTKNLFSNLSQTKKYQTDLLTEKLGFYQNSLNRIQDDQSKRNEEADLKERTLRQNIFQLQIKARQTIEELQKAKRELYLIQQQKAESRQGSNQIRS